jgi:heme O synthase-like polyprenyltransferase
MSASHAPASTASSATVVTMMLKWREILFMIARPGNSESAADYVVAHAFRILFPFALVGLRARGAGALLRRAVRARRAKLFAARRTFRYSIVYLALLFAALLADHYV